MKHNFVKRDYFEQLAKDCAEIEIYRFEDDRNNIIHTDTIRYMDVSLDYLPEEVDCEWELMDEAEYNRTVLANGCELSDFEGWYGSKEARVLVIVLYNGNFNE